jgi:hypothetical protein
LKTTNKAWLVFISFILVMVIIACSCGSLSPATPSSSFATSSVATSTQAIGSATADSAHGMAGKWEETVFNNIHTIIWQNDGYVVVSTIHKPDGANYPITSQSWSNGVLTWTYSVPGGGEDTIKTVSLTPDNAILSVAWSNTGGNAGTFILQRAP